MRDGMHSFDVTADRSATKGIALVENDKIKGFSWSHDYEVERSKRGEKAKWFVRKRQPSSGTRGRGEFFPAKLEGEEGKDWFSLKGALHGDSNAKISIQGKRLRDLPF
jgi:hypothetical protein